MPLRRPRQPVVSPAIRSILVSRAINKPSCVRCWQRGGYPADAVTFHTSLHIAESVLLRRSYPTAPVSALYLWNRKQDLAFEQPVGSSARQRHHLRLWRSDQFGNDGQPLWLGAATFDQRVGVSHVTGEITHHIAPDIDAERNGVITGLEHAGQLVLVYQVTGVGATVAGRNSGGDWYYTDGTYRQRTST